MSSTAFSRSLARQVAFQPQAARGGLQRSDGQPVAMLPLAWLHDLHASIVQEFSDNAADVLYRCGYEWGLQDMVTLTRRMRQQMGGGDFDLWELDAKFVYESWWAPLHEAGWGQCRFEVTAHARGLLLVELRASAVAAVLPGSDQPVCHLYAGLFAAVVSFFDRTERHAAEVDCAAMGAPACRFLVGSGADIDSAEGWRQQGTAADEIIRRLR